MSGDPGVVAAKTENIVSFDIEGRQYVVANIEQSWQGGVPSRL